MPARSVEVEFVRYRKPDVLHASVKLIQNFAVYSGIVGAKSWPRLLYGLRQIVMEEDDAEILWKTPVVDLRFSGFPPPTPSIQGERVIFAAREPRFTFEEKRDDSIRPAVVTHVKRVTDAIAREMEEVYRLLRVEESPTVLVFPKSEYAESVKVFNAILLQPIQ